MMPAIIATENKPKTRPYWHVDMKWIITLIFIPILTVTFMLINLYILTNSTNAVKTSTTLLSTMYTTGQNTDSSALKDQIREQMKKNPDGVFKPFPGVDAQVTEQDLNQYSVTDLKQQLFGKLATSIYNFDPSSSALNNNGKSGIVSSLGFMAIFTSAGHTFITKIMWYAIAVSLLLLALLIYFSYGFGRFVSPGLIFILIGVPQYIAFSVLKNMSSTTQSVLGSADVNIQQRLSDILSKIGPDIATIFTKNYLLLILVGLALLPTGLIGGITHKIMTRHKPN